VAGRAFRRAVEAPAPEGWLGEAIEGTNESDIQCLRLPAIAADLTR
jgi:hypothetical protein